MFSSHWLRVRNCESLYEKIVSSLNFLKWSHNFENILVSRERSVQEINCEIGNVVSRRLKQKMQSQRFQIKTEKLRKIDFAHLFLIMGPLRLVSHIKNIPFLWHFRRMMEKLLNSRQETHLFVDRKVVLTCRNLLDPQYQTDLKCMVHHRS